MWAVVNSGGLVARYVYLPFGGMVADGPNPNVTAYRFMGQEWDAELALFNFHDRMYDPCTATLSRSRYRPPVSESIRVLRKQPSEYDRS